MPGRDGPRSGGACALAVVGAILPILAVASWPIVSRLERQAVLRDDEIDILRAVPLFEPLPLDALERIAVAMTPVRFEPGAALMREGDPGDRYIVLTEGQSTSCAADGRWPSAGLVRVSARPPS